MPSAARKYTAAFSVLAVPHGQRAATGGPCLLHPLWIHHSKRGRLGLCCHKRASLTVYGHIQVERACICRAELELENIHRPALTPPAVRPRHHHGAAAPSPKQGVPASLVQVMDGASLDGGVVPVEVWDHDWILQIPIG